MENSGTPARLQRLLHLASASARRRDILAALGIDHTWGGVDIDETPRAGEAPAALVRRLASAKAAAAQVRGHAADLIIGADTVVILEERIFGKPVSREDALDMLSRLSGRRHTVMTAVALKSGEQEWVATSATSVQFRAIGAGEARAYWDTGEARGKAGAYAVQGLGGVFVESLSGSYTGVVGLPVFETAALLRRAGFDVLTAGGRGGNRPGS